MYRDAPNYFEEEGLTLPRINLLLEQGERRRTLEHRQLAAAVRAAHGEEPLDKVFKLGAERKKGDGSPDSAPRDLEPWWAEDDEPEDPDA